ncbi:phosphoethanolamine transferase [Pseudomonas boanensis]|uniref:phosphoethanolamine transferase n=1 Tax=Metapseudomonas boanensis TaxID=2822138 RepID=UPI0035D462C8
MIKGRSAVRVFVVLLILLVFLALMAVGGLLFLGRGEELKLVASILYSRKAEYLFFAGATYVSLLLLNKRRFISAVITFLVGLAWMLFHQPVSGFIGSLGVDSFSEAKDFDFEEAKFWLATMQETIKPDFRMKALALYLLYLLMAVSSFYLLKWWLHSRTFTKQYYTHIKLALSGLLVIGAILLTFLDSASLFFSNSESYLVVKSNFSNEPPEAVQAEGKVDVFVYVGESTSVMNMSLYGYPRDTTPRLKKVFDEDPNFILFENVFSTHTHTSPSLLEAFSFALHSEEDFLPIERRRRISVVDVLRKAKVDVRLISNQGMVGTWNQASSIIFKNAENTFSTDSRRLGNSDGKAARPWDDAFFEAQLANLDFSSKSNASVTFLHSYAGHGEYLANIPEEWRVPVDGYFSSGSGIRMSEADYVSIESVDAYDSAVKYIDYSVSKTLDYVRGLDTPAVLIYFSDHGDSVFTGKGHDSSRFTHEMARVPFFIYFNGPARLQRAELYRKYVTLAKSSRTASLAQLSATILDVAGVRVKNTATSKMDLKPVVGEEAQLPPIVVREISDGISFVNLSAEKPARPKFDQFNFIDSTDADTSSYLDVKGGRILASDYCRKMELSFESARRRQIIGGCKSLSLIGLGNNLELVGDKE